MRRRPPLLLPWLSSVGPRPSRPGAQGRPLGVQGEHVGRATSCVLRRELGVYDPLGLIETRNMFRYEP